VNEEQAAELLEQHKKGLLKVSALALQEGIKAERKRILSLLTDDSPVWEGNVQQNLIDVVNNEELCGDCKGNCCG
jgi:hypothetical protein